MLVPPRRLASAVSLLVAGGVLAGCGSSSDSAGAASSTTPTTRPSGAPSRPNGAQAEQFAKIQECLAAAGITVDIPSGLPSRPTGTAPPAGSGGASPPSGAPGGGLGGAFSDPDAQAALNACGITLPTGPPSGR